MTTFRIWTNARVWLTSRLADGSAYSSETANSNDFNDAVAFIHGEEHA